MTSSIHTIHRPVARSRRTKDQSPGSHPVIREEISIESTDDDASTASPEPHSDSEREDFEKTPQISSPEASPFFITTQSPASSLTTLNKRRTFIRSESTTTVRLQRRARLAEKLQVIFDIKDITEVRAEMPCWLLRSVCKSQYSVVQLTFLTRLLYSAAGLYVSYKFTSMLFRALTISRGSFLNDSISLFILIVD